jgi:hypothetical protein
LTVRVPAVEAIASSCGLCFPAGTPVHTKRGLVPIEKIKVGDQVLSRNMTSGKLEYGKVTKLVKPHLSKVLSVKFAGQSTPLLPTPEHPFFIKHADGSEGHWVPAGQMRAGDYALARKGTWAKVISITAVESERTVYNFEVEANHDYFVGLAGLLVHNGCDSLRAIAQPIIDSFGNLQCAECVAALGDAFEKAGYSANVIELTPTSPAAELIFSSNYPSEAISRTGYHAAIEVEGLIFDNLVNGISRSAWQQSIRTISGDFATSFNVEITPFSKWILR